MLILNKFKPKEDDKRKCNNQDDGRPKWKNYDDNKPKRKDHDDNKPKWKDRDHDKPKRKDCDDHKPKWKDRDDDKPKWKDCDDDKPKWKDCDDDKPKWKDCDDDKPKWKDCDDEKPKWKDCDDEKHKCKDHDDHKSKENKNKPQINYKYESDKCEYHPKKKKIKSLVVIAEEVVQKTGMLEINAPIGVSIDHSGELSVPLKLIPVGEPIMKPTIIKNKLINEGLVNVKLVVDDLKSDLCCDVTKGMTRKLCIPIHHFMEIDCIKPGDHVQEEVEIEHLSLLGLPDCDMEASSGQKIKLLIKVILKVSIVICREELITVALC